MLSPRARSQDMEGPLAAQGKGKVECLGPHVPSSAPTRCPTLDDLLTLDDDQDGDAHQEDWGVAALSRGGDEPALLKTALFETVPVRDERPGRGSAMPAPPPRRLQSEAYWELKAAAARRLACSPWEVGVRPRCPRVDEGGYLGPAAAAPAAAEGAEGEGPAAAEPPAAGAAQGGGAEGGPRSWAGAISRELRRGALVPVVAPLASPPAAPPRSPSAAVGAALRSRGRSYHTSRGC
ncbi:unnamed protein product [Prorocentrum cordatum]|uniref:Uncharacterized protein n=1 Tax=Prorocentrum cordatum TaxID=2364126 RepID=A0ABN9TT89_9DINO|nr:unnamed protein product [Polarella glacialis]